MFKNDASFLTTSVIKRSNSEKHCWFAISKKEEKEIGKMIEFVAKAILPTRFGKFDIYAFKDSEGKEHLAIVSGNITKNPVAARIHSQCLTGDTFCSLRCDCRAQLEKSLCMISKKGGVFIYLDQEGRGIGLTNKIKAYALQEMGKDTIDANLELGFAADSRDYKIAADILKFFKIRKIKLITNNPLKINGLNESGIEITERISLKIKPNRFNKKYLETKCKRMGHL